MNPPSTLQPILEHIGISVATIAGMILTLALRLAGIRWKLGLPLLETR